MKQWKSVALSFLFLTAVSTGAYAQTPCCNVQEQRYYTSTGTAEIRVKPDRVTLTLGVQERSSNLAAARDKMNAVIKAAIAHSRQKGVPEKNIQTARLDIRPAYRYDEQNKLELTYYEFNQTLTITLENVDLYDQLIYDLLGMGINTVNDVQFTSSEVRKYRDQARLQAVQAAKEKALLLTQAAGVKLGDVVNVSEEGGYYPMYRNSQMLNSSQNISQDMGGSGGDESGSAAGMISIKATVNLTYKLVD